MHCIFVDQPLKIAHELSHKNANRKEIMYFVLQMNQCMRNVASNIHALSEEVHCAVYRRFDTFINIFLNIG